MLASSGKYTLSYKSMSKEYVYTHANMQCNALGFIINNVTPIIMFNSPVILSGLLSGLYPVIVAIYMQRMYTSGLNLKS